MVKKRIYWKLARGWELFAIVLMLASLMALFQETNILFKDGLSWMPHLTSTIKFSGVTAFWVTIILFHLASFFVVARSVIIESHNKTSNVYDYIFGFALLFAVYGVIVSTVYGLYGSTPNIIFLGNIAYLLLIKISFGVIALCTLWYGFTD